MSAKSYETGAQFGGALVWMAVLGVLTMVTWNHVVPFAFGLPELGYWRALALTWLVRMPTLRSRPEAKP